MKTLVLVNGTMGVGKTATCRALLEQMAPAAFIDGDWGWAISPFEVTDENRAMVLDNIGHLIRNYARHSSIDTIILGWVMHTEEIIRAVLDPLEDLNLHIVTVTLTISAAKLRERLQGDIDAGIRQPDIVERSIARLALYDAMPTHKIDVGQCSASEAAAQIAAYIRAQ